MSNTRRTARYPDFLGIGAQKAGTTWLHFQLSLQRSVWMPRIKELQYFNELHMPSHAKWTRTHRLSHAEKTLRDFVAKLPDGQTVDWQIVRELVLTVAPEIGDDWYGSIFALAPDGAVAGELTPEYSLLPEKGIEHIRRLNQGLKIIFVIRDPIARAWSHIKMLRKRRDTTADIESMCRTAQLEDVISRSDYGAILDRWGKVFADDKFLVLNYDDIGTNPGKVVAETCEFLGVSYEQNSRALERKVHVGEPGELPPEVYEVLKSELRGAYECDANKPSLAAALETWRLRHYGQARA